MNQKRFVLVLILAAAVGFLALGLINAGEEPPPSPTSAAQAADRAAREAGVRPGKIIWANWHERKPPPDPGAQPGAMRDLGKREESALPEEVRTRIQERFRGVDVYVPGAGR